MNIYMKNRWKNRRRSAIEYLGGKCVVCGATENLEFDHVDPNTKVASIARLSSASEYKFYLEINKCQLLCHSHHKEKTLVETRR